MCVRTCLCADVDEISSNQNKSILSGELFFWKYKTTLSTVDSVVLDFQTRSVRLRTAEFWQRQQEGRRTRCVKYGGWSTVFWWVSPRGAYPSLYWPYLVKKFIILRLYWRPRKWVDSSQAESVSVDSLLTSMVYTHALVPGPGEELSKEAKNKKDQQRRGSWYFGYPAIVA